MAGREPHLDAVLDLSAMEDALLREGAKAGQRVHVHAEQVLALQHSHALGIAAVLLRQLQPLCAAVGLRTTCADTV